MISDFLFPEYKVALDVAYQHIGGSQCFYALSSLMCAPCAPGSAAYLNGGLTTDTITFSLCASTCDNLFAACSGIVPGNWSYVSNSIAFCSLLFSDYHSFTYEGTTKSLTVNIDTSPTSTQCFHNVPVDTVTRASCMSKYPQPGATTTSTAATATASATATAGTTYAATSRSSSSTTGTGSSTKGIGVSATTVAAVIVITVLVVAAATGGVMYYRRHRGNRQHTSFLPFHNGPQPITAIHPDDDDDEIGSIN